MIAAIKLAVKQHQQKLESLFFKQDPVYRNCKFVLRKMSKRGFIFADSYLRIRYGLDLLAILTACKTLLRPINSRNIPSISLQFLSTNAIKIFTDCTSREEVLCRLYELKHSINNAMQYQLQFTGIINEKIVTTRALERILDSAIFTINCLDINFIQSNSLALEQTLKILGYPKRDTTTLTTKQLQVLISLLLWRAALVAEQTVFGDYYVNLKLAIKLLNRSIRKFSPQLSLELIKIALLDLYENTSNEYFLIKGLIDKHEMLEVDVQKDESDNKIIPLFPYLKLRPSASKGDV